MDLYSDIYLIIIGSVTKQIIEATTWIYKTKQFTLFNIELDTIGLRQNVCCGISIKNNTHFIEQWLIDVNNENYNINKIAQKQTFNTNNLWLNNNNLSHCRLGIESLTLSLITRIDKGVSFPNLISTEYISTVILVIDTKDLQMSLSALKNVQFLILLRIENIMNDNIINKLLLISLNRTKSSSDYMSKIQFGPIAKLIGKSASVRSLSFEIIIDIIDHEYNNYIIKYKITIILFIYVFN